MISKLNYKSNLKNCSSIILACVLRKTEQARYGPHLAAEGLEVQAKHALNATQSTKIG